MEDEKLKVKIWQGEACPAPARTRPYRHGRMTWSGGKPALGGRSGGFSLIELLIVITIIGLLSTIILSSLSNSRAKAYDSKVKQQLSSFRTSAEIYSSNQDPNGYGPASAICSSGIFNDVQLENGTPGIYIATGNLPDFAVPVCQATDSAYAVKAPLYSGNEYWCVDSKGASMRVDGPITGPTTICP